MSIVINRYGCNTRNLTLNPLHEQHEKLICFSALVDEPDANAERIAESANDGDELAISWLTRIERYGVSSAMLEEIEKLVRRIKFETSLKLDRASGRFVWKKRIPFLYEPKGQAPDRETAYALMMLQLVESGIADQFRRCCLDECQRFFFYTNVRKRWCSDQCGSLHRVRSKRKKDRARGIL